MLSLFHQMILKCFILSDKKLSTGKLLLELIQRLT